MSKQPHEIDDPIERALAHVATFKGDARSSLNCFHAETLATELLRLRAANVEADDLLREVIGDDDPRTWEPDEQWAEILEGRGEHDHIEISVYAGTLRRILARVRDRSKESK